MDRTWIAVVVGGVVIAYVARQQARRAGYELGRGAVGGALQGLLERLASYSTRGRAPTPPSDPVGQRQWEADWILE